MHRDAAYAIADETCADAELLAAARRSWDEALAARRGARLPQRAGDRPAPTGTITFLMDCDTTGIEPDFSLVKFKELVGGGQMTIVNRTVPLALQTLGYSEQQVEQIEAHLTSTARSSERPASPRSTCRCSTSRSASGRSRTWATWR